MKFSLAALAVCAFALFAQEQPSNQLKHLSVPAGTSLRPLSVSARDITRELPYPSVIHLKGSVEIRTPVCTGTAEPGKWTCDGSVVLRADEADLHEDTGEIEARGNVKVTRERTADARNGR